MAATAGSSPDRQGRHVAEGCALGLEVSAVALYALADLLGEVKTVGAGRIGRRRRRVPLSGRPIHRARRAARRAAAAHALLDHALEGGSFVTESLLARRQIGRHGLAAAAAVELLVVDLAGAVERSVIAAGRRYRVRFDELGPGRLVA